MKLLIQSINVITLGFTALSAVIAVVLWVVCFILVFYIRQQPMVADEFPMLLAAAGSFSFIACIFSASIWLQHRDHWATWLLRVIGFGFSYAIVTLFRNL